MAIKNASDLLVYAQTNYDVNGNPAPAKQVTRIYVKTVDPITIADGDSFGTLKIDNITNASGVVFDDVETSDSIVNTGTSVLDKIDSQLTAVALAKGYTAIGSQTVSGDYTYQDFQNGANGIVPTLVIKNGQATLNEDAVIIEIVTPGSSAIFDPVAFSTSASFSVNMDLRDVTNKDSGGYSESLGGLRSFEVSTDLLQSINPDVPLDGTDFFDKLKARSLVDLSFSDRIRNIIRTNLTQSGVDGFVSSSGTQTNLQADPFGGSTASKFLTAASTTNKYVGYTIDATRVENKKVNWSFYVKGVDASNREASFALSNSSIVGASTVTKIEGDGDIAFVTSSYYKITNLSTSTWTRISFQTDTISLSGWSTLSFYIYPGLYSAQDSDEIFTSSWQIELAPEATDYQDPTDITHWQGNALVSSVSFDAGVEDNLTCSATFTGTGEIFPNGLGPELIGDTGFDDASYWTVDGGSVVENGYGKIIAPSGSADSYILKSGILTVGDYYLLTYTIPSASPGTGNIKLQTSFNLPLLKTVGTHKLEFVAANNIFKIGRLENPCDIWLSSISLKKVL